MACCKKLVNRVCRWQGLTTDTINQSLVEMDYSVKSKVYIRYLKHLSDMARGVKKPFPALVPANMGDPQGFGQPPLTFMRQVLALCLSPEMRKDPSFSFPEDVKTRAKQILAELPYGSVGAAAESRGLRVVRKHVCEYIRDRDCGGDASPDRIVVQESHRSIDTLFKLVAYRPDYDERRAGVLVPVPMYPVYSACLCKNGVQAVGYYLNEENDWELDVKELKEIVDEARGFCRPRGMVVINPGNPTGQVLSEQNIQDIIKFCYEQNLFIFADEVYQQNLLDPTAEFHSFKKIKRQLGAPFADVELASIHSASKGLTGECGLRGGYIELDGFDEDVASVFAGTAALNRTANAAGQIAVDVMTKPPAEGDPSWELYRRERITISARMVQKAGFLVDRLNAIDGIRVNPLRAGLFAYASILDMPPRAVRKADRLKQDPSLMWALELLDDTGIAIVPGSSFSQRPGTYHFRVTIVPTIEVIEKIVKGIKQFHYKFVKAYK